MKVKRGPQFVQISRRNRVHRKRKGDPKLIRRESKKLSRDH